MTKKPGTISASGANDDTATPSLLLWVPIVGFCLCAKGLDKERALSRARQPEGRRAEEKLCAKDPVFRSSRGCETKKAQAVAVLQGNSK